MSKPKIGKPYRWQGIRLLMVPEVGDKENQCKGCLSEEESNSDNDERRFRDLCEIRGDNDCSNADDDQEHRQPHIFIKDTKASIAEYIARRVEG